LAIKWAKERLRIYILGAPRFRIVTPHKPLVPLFNNHSLLSMLRLTEIYGGPLLPQQNKICQGKFKFITAKIKFKRNSNYSRQTTHTCGKNKNKYLNSSFITSSETQG